MNHLWAWFATWLVRRRTLVNWLIAHCKKHPYFHIYEDGQLYMARFWLIKERPWLPFAIRLHEWHQPDSTRDLHDHPYDFRTIILRGWYVERDLYGNLVQMKAGMTAAHRREHLHTIIALSKMTTAYSLFIYWGKRQPWGFLVDGKKIPWQEYVDGNEYPAEYQDKRSDW